GTKIVLHNLQTGDTLWTKNLPVDFPSTDWRNRVSAIQDGLVYCTRAGNNNESYLYALNVENGSIVWKSDNVIDEGSTEGLAFAPNGDPIVGSMWYITRFNKANGTTVWRTDRLSYDDGGGVVVANNKVYSIKNLINYVGIAVYNLESGEELYTSAQLSGGLVNQLGFFAGSDGTIYLPRCQNNPVTDSLFALKDDGDFLRKKWSIPITYTPFATHGVGPDGSVYAYNRSGEIMRLNPENGEVLNTSKVIIFGDANSPRMAIDAAGNIFVTNGGFAQGMFYSFNPDLSLRWEETFLNINVGGPAIGSNGTLVVTGKGTQVKAYVGTGLPETDFTKVTEGDIVNDGGWNYGMVWADFNNDNFADLFVANNDGDNGKLNFLYMNNGDGTFEKITESMVVTDGGSSYAATAADYNQDGNMDLFVANHNENNFLYFGNGDGTFEKVTQGIVVTDGGKSVGCSWVDYNVDGYPDLFVANRDQKNFLYMGEGASGYFTKITDGSIVNDIDNSSGCAWGDYDNDGYPDLYVANSGSASSLYHNDYGYSFTKVETEPFISDVSSCAGASWGDVDNDGDLDLFVSTGQLGMYVNWFYKNNGDGTFTKVTDSPLVNEATWSSGSAWGDYDKDGDIDLAVGGYDGNNRLFKNDGSGNFEKVLDNAFVNEGNYTEGLAWADYDDDGDLDIFTAKNNYFGGNNSFFINQGNPNNWLKVYLRNCGSCIWNFGALGAKVCVYASVNGESVMQMRELTAQSGGGQGGQNEMVQFFGLGDAAIVDSVVVHWMYDTWTEENVDVNQTLTMDLFTAINEIEHESIISAYPNPASDFITFNIENPGNEAAMLAVFDLQGRSIASFKTSNNTLEWNLRDHSGKRLPAGLYACKITMGNKREVLKFVVE
ncbi:MAG: FG-GAP-like repeat-containing protein, partial [Bacteroidales bacterium]|nr:FG-GAP-like repeat-containing protein [Bacteroidales bacterium]